MRLARLGIRPQEPVQSWCDPQRLRVRSYSVGVDEPADLPAEFPVAEPDRVKNRMIVTANTTPEPPPEGMVKGPYSVPTYQTVVDDGLPVLDGRAVGPARDGLTRMTRAPSQTFFRVIWEALDGSPGGWRVPGQRRWRGPRRCWSALPAEESMPELAAEVQDDRSESPKSTPWGRAYRLKPPARVGAAGLHWDSPATRHGSTAADMLRGREIWAGRLKRTWPSGGTALTMLSTVRKATRPNTLVEATASDTCSERCTASKAYCRIALS